MSFVIMASTDSGLVYFTDPITIKVLAPIAGLPSNPRAPYMLGVSTIALGFLNETTEVQLPSAIDPDGKPVTFLDAVVYPSIGSEFIQLDKFTRKITIKPTSDLSHSGVFLLTIGIIDHDSLTTYYNISVLVKPAP